MRKEYDCKRLRCNCTLSLEFIRDVLDVIEQYNLLDAVEITSTYGCYNGKSQGTKFQNLRLGLFT